MLDNFLKMLKGAGKSWTIWGNIALGTILVLSLVYQLSEAEKNIITDFWNSPQTQAFAILIYNIIIRFFTNKSLKDK